MTTMRWAQVAPATLLLLVSSIAWSQTTTFLPLTDDAWVKGSQSGLNNAAHPRITVGRWGPKQGLFRFDASSLAGKTISEATLRLEVQEVGTGGKLTVHPITSSWDEETVTWDSRPSIEPRSVASLNVGEFLERVFSLDVTSTVQRWADGTLPDAGFLLLPDGFASVVQFHSKETSGGQPASLKVTTGQPPVGDNVALGRTVATTGEFFVGGFGARQTVDFSTVTDGTIFKSGQEWTAGAVWWEEATDTIQNSVTIYLGDTYQIQRIIVQLDNNDDYILSWDDMLSGPRSLVVSPTFIPFPGGLATPVEIALNAMTDSFVIRADVDGRSDGFFAIAEFQAFATVVP